MNESISPGFPGMWLKAEILGNPSLSHQEMLLAGYLDTMTLQNVPKKVDYRLFDYFFNIKKQELYKIINHLCEEHYLSIVDESDNWITIEFHILEEHRAFRYAHPLNKEDDD